MWEGSGVVAGVFDVPFYFYQMEEFLSVTAGVFFCFSPTLSAGQRGLIAG